MLIAAGTNAEEILNSVAISAPEADVDETGKSKYRREATSRGRPWGFSDWRIPQVFMVDRVIP
jgi:hypothetical protein